MLLEFESEHQPSSVDQALESVLSADKSEVYASADNLFKGAVFGRDSLEVAEDVIDSHPAITRTVIHRLAGLQGKRFNAISEEAPGKIHHEHRDSTINGLPLDATSQLIFDTLSAKWGGSAESFTYYGSVDATPLYIRTVLTYCQQYGDQLLGEIVECQDGSKTTIYESLRAAVNWTMHAIADSPNGLLGYRAQNPLGIENQVWKDSAEFYVHRNGERANHSMPIASIEVQGLVYDAFVLAERLFGEYELQRRAESLRDRCIEKLWLPEERYFALGTDFDDYGNERIITTRTANPAELLDTMFFDDLPVQQRQVMLHGIINMIIGPDFLTDAGIRSRALSEAHLVDIWDYHGSYVSWPKETYDIAKGLRRHGYLMLAEQLENRILNIVRSSGSYPEFVYVDEQGQVLNQLVDEMHQESNTTEVLSSNEPERLQAWTVSAVAAIEERRKRSQEEYSAAAPWHDPNRLEILPALSSQEKLAQRYPKKAYRVKKLSGDAPANVAWLPPEA